MLSAASTNSSSACSSNISTNMPARLAVWRGVRQAIHDHALYDERCCLLARAVLLPKDLHHAPWRARVAKHRQHGVAVSAVGEHRVGALVRVVMSRCKLAFYYWVLQVGLCSCLLQGTLSGCSVCSKCRKTSFAAAHLLRGSSGLHLSSLRAHIIEQACAA